ncbi:unnamed protein product [Symbiodinium sp. CCMP2592]|nr:unnamed protein product [Symbiodinium sp. CCMP2592]
MGHLSVCQISLFGRHASAWTASSSSRIEKKEGERVRERERVLKRTRNKKRSGLASCFQATWNNLIHGGCETRAVFHNNVFPASAHVTYETHDMRGNPANRTLRRKAHGITRGCYP